MGKKRKFWTLSEVKKITNLIKIHGLQEGVKKASEMFGVNSGAVYTRYTRYLRGDSMRNMGGTPEKKKYDKMKSPAVKPNDKLKTNVHYKGQKLEIDIQTIEIDLKNRKIIITY